MNFVYAAVCLVLTPISVFTGGFIDYYFGIWWLGIVLSAIPILLICACLSFIISSVNVEIWDECYMGRRL